MAWSTAAVAKDLTELAVASEVKARACREAREAADAAVAMARAAERALTRAAMVAT